MTTFKTNTNDQGQTDLISSIDDTDTDIINYDNNKCVLDYKKIINMENTHAFVNLDQISEITLYEFYNHIKRNPEMVKLIDVKADVEFSLNRSINTDSLFSDFLFKTFFHSTTKYALHNCASLVQLHEAQTAPLWINAGSCKSLCESTPHSLDTFELALYQLNPSKIIFLESESHPFTTHRGLVFGFGVYLFDKHNQLISKMVYKFFDESVAPQNAYRLNAPITFAQLQNRSRPFF